MLTKENSYLSVFSLFLTVALSGVLAGCTVSKRGDRSYRSGRYRGKSAKPRGYCPSYKYRGMGSCVSRCSMGTIAWRPVPGQAGFCSTVAHLQQTIIAYNRILIRYYRMRSRRGSRKVIRSFRRAVARAKFALRRLQRQGGDRAGEAASPLRDADAPAAPAGDAPPPPASDGPPPPTTGGPPPPRDGPPPPRGGPPPPNDGPPPPKGGSTSP